MLCSSQPGRSFHAIGDGSSLRPHGRSRTALRVLGKSGSVHAGRSRARHFVNLTNGIEALPLLHELGVPSTFVRMQSTLCEAQAMEKFMLELDSHFLMSLALGYDCFVYDYASRNRKRGVPRALWYGLEFATFALDKLWFGRAFRPPILRGHNVTGDFDEKLNKFDKSSRQRLRYYAQYTRGEAATEGVKLWGICGGTENDADGEFYRRTLREAEEAGQGPSSGAAAAAKRVLLPAAASAAAGGIADELGLDGADAMAIARGAGPAGPGADAARADRLAQARVALGADLHSALQRQGGLDLFVGGLGHKEYRQQASAAVGGVGSGGVPQAAGDGGGGGRASGGGGVSCGESSSNNSSQD